ncbi:MAG: OmpA family protein [Polyangia bacterium]
MRRTLAACCFALTGLVSSADAQTAGTNRGFELNRYEPTAAGEWSFAVDHPWYSSLRYFAGGITLNYAHNPLVLGQRSPAGDYSVLRPIIEHRLMGHVDVAGSFADRVLVGFSLPVVLMERGNSEAGVRPIDTAALGDPRIGARFRLLGQPYGSAFSLSLGLDLWIPLNSTRSGDGTSQEQVGETGVRLLPKLMMGGLSHSVMWSFSLGFMYRPVQSIGNIPPLNGNTVGSELQLGFGVKYASLANRLAIGPEVLLSTGMAGFTAFRVGWTSLEALLGVQYNIARLIQLGIAGGVGALREPGTPDGRVLLRLAYAPMGPAPPKDRDRDGIPDAQDACPEEAGGRTETPATNGCPAAPPAPADRDGDGVLDAQDLCPGEPAGSRPDPQKPGCPLRDADGDGVADAEDQCPGEAAGARPDPQKPGCPLRDSDGDGVFDREDQCPGEAAGAHPDPQRPGCPDKDSDHDGIYDGQDSCKEVPAGLNPDPQKPGCPLPDRDLDQIPDRTDACPDKAGSPSPDPKRNGCPGLVEVKAGQIVILQQVFFATGKDEILKKSFPLLDSIVHTLRTIPAIKKIEIEGHTDNKGAADKNIDLSARRARSVQRYLTDHGIAAERLVANGYGPNRPIAENTTEKGRAKNRRVDFRIIDPPQPEAAPQRTEPPAPPALKKASRKGDTAPPAGKAT